MNRLLSFVFVLVIGALGACTTPVQVKAAVDVKVVKTPAGFTVWQVEDHALPLIAVQILFKDAGSTQDPPGKAGTATFVASMLDEGAGKLDSAAFQQRLEDKSIKLGFSASRDRFAVSLATLSKNRDEAFHLMGLALTKPRFDDDAVERVRNQLLGAISQGNENPSQVARWAWYAAAYPDHAYGQPVEGTADSVKRILRADLKDFAATRFARDNIIIAVVGDITEKDLGTLVDSALGGLAAKAQTVPVPPATAHPPAGIRVIKRPIPQSTVYFGENGIRRDDPEWYAAYVMNYVLGGGGFASRLMNEVRVKRGLAYSLATYFQPFDHGGLFIGAVGTKNERVAQSIEVIQAELKKIIAGGITKEELKDAKTYLTGSYPLNFDTSGDIAGQLAAIQAEGFGPDYVKKRNGYIDAVTLDEANAAARELLHPDKLFWLVVGEPAGVTETVPEPASPEKASAAK